VITPLRKQRRVNKKRRMAKNEARDGNQQANRGNAHDGRAWRCGKRWDNSDAALGRRHSLSEGHSFRRPARM